MIDSLPMLHKTQIFVGLLAYELVSKEQEQVKYRIKVSTTAYITYTEIPSLKIYRNDNFHACIKGDK